MLTYLTIEIRRILRDPVAFMFTVGIPTFMFIIFGVSQEWGAYEYEHGNVSAGVMISMAAYGAVTATTSVGGSAAIERLQGWGRQLGLTPMPDSRFILVKSIIGIAQASIPLIIIYTIGYFTNAEAEWWVWLSSAALVLLGAMLFSLYGLTMGSLIRSESAVGISSGMVVVFGFLGNVFMPLTGWMLTISKFTPLYGVAALARRPLTAGYTLDGSTYELVLEPLLPILANVVVWVVLFAVASILLVRRGRERQ